MPDPTHATIEWMAQPGPPNIIFILTLLTAPHLWSRYVKKYLKQKYGGGSE